MVKIKIKTGLDIPMKGGAIGGVKASNEGSFFGHDFSSFTHVKLKLLVKEGDKVNVGTPLASDKNCNERLFVSLASGQVSEVIRGEKRKLMCVVVHKEEVEKQVKLPQLNCSQASLEEILSLLKLGGAFAHIRKRPCNVLAHPGKPPRSIFIQALESAPFQPPAELQLEGEVDCFHSGLQALMRLSPGNVHLVTRKSSLIDQQLNNSEIKVHYASGVHPCANPSVHIDAIAPIQGASDVVWTLHLTDLLYVGALVLGKIKTKKVIAVAGEGVAEKKRGFYRVRSGTQISQLIDDKSDFTLLSGDPLNGKKCARSDYLGFNHRVLSAIPHANKRQLFHFFRWGFDKFTSSRTYLGGFFKRPFSPNDLVHGEERAFVDGAVYDRVMPLSVPTMPLIKALLAQDFETAVDLGLLEVAGEDFALCSFVCPSKIDFLKIVEEKLNEYADQYIE